MKITPDHLARGAFIYIRQSTVDQLANNHESRLRQYGLADRARALGWTDVTVIDDDLGRSGSGVSRPGFERLLAAICEGRVGAVFAIEASRLARNGRDWHTLIEFCGLVGTVIVDEDGVYEPRHPNDRLLWELPVYATVSNLLTNPVYAGAYAFGRTGSRMTIENGRKRILRGHRKDRSDWAVLLVDHHEGYLSWADYERNQRLIADNANGKGMMVRGAVRTGEALLAGLLRCGHCGRRLLVGYAEQ